ncbi:MAG: M28 family peptidase [Armatimonadetes bacterium]|nr:M28 family peptidase [Armatimonadota bacterium]
MNRFFLPRVSLVLSTTVLVSLPALAAGTLSEADAKKDAEKTLTQRNLRSYLTFIASDELEGRDTPSNGLNTAARYISTFLDRWGFVPKGDNGTFYQTIRVRSTYIDNDKSAATVAGKTLTAGQDFLPQGGSEKNSAVATPAPLVFVGHGWFVKGKLDAYAGVDVRGKIVVVAPLPRFLPFGVTQDDIPRDKRGTDWMPPEEYAKAQGAVGVIRLPSEDAATWAKTAAGTRPSRRVQLSPVYPNAAEDTDVPIIGVSPEVATALLAGEKTDLATAIADARAKTETGAFALAPDKTATLAVGIRTETVSTQNVVAAWEGSDDKLKNEYVALGAHYDHVGLSTNANAPDKIYNGADDDGSGTVGLLSMAETLASHPDKRPKRSLLFVWHCGEEKGLWGSEYFTRSPTVPLASIKAQLNCDMIGRSKPEGDTQERNKTLSSPDTIYVIGARMISPTLGDIVDKVNHDYTRLNYDTRYDDPKDPNRFYYRSDHYNYAKRGIPIAFFFDGVHVDYHRPSDEVSKIDFPKYERVVRTVFVTAVAVANAPSLSVPAAKATP